MKKKVMLSEEALRVMLGESAEETAEGAGVDVSAEGNDVDTESHQDEDLDDTDAGEGEDALEALQKEFDDYKAIAESAAEEAAGVAAELEELKTDLAARDAAIEELAASNVKCVKIIADQTNRMKKALGQEALAEDLSAAEVVKAFEATKIVFMKTLPVGSVVPKAKAEPKEKSVKSSMDASAYRALDM